MSTNRHPNRPTPAPQPAVNPAPNTLKKAAHQVVEKLKKLIAPPLPLTPHGPKTDKDLSRWSNEGGHS